MGEPLNLLSDAELVSLCQGGNLEAFNRLAARWNSDLYRFARRMVGNDEDARDICQEALIKAYRNIQRLREPAKFKGWVYHITLNLCRDRFRSARFRKASEPFEEGRPDEFRIIEGKGTPGAPDRHAHESGLVGILGEVMAEIPVEQRTAILLREYQGFTSDEIAEITGVPSATVRTRIFYGLKAVRRRLEARGITETGIQ